MAMGPGAHTDPRTAPRVLPGDALADSPVREWAMEGVLVAVGRLGYREASVRAALEYSGGHRKQFYAEFASKDDCFEQAYSTWTERLYVDLLEAAVRAESWRLGVRAALVRLFELVEAQPLIARALFVEAQLAGGETPARRERAIERIAAALDSVRDEIPADAQPPEATGVFVVGGVEACVCDALTAGDPSRIWDALPELMQLAVGSYLDREAAEAAAEDARELLARERASGAER